MGNAECCDSQKNPEFKLEKSEHKINLKPLIREISTAQPPLVIKHDRIQTIQPNPPTSPLDHNHNHNTSQSPNHHTPASPLTHTFSAQPPANSLFKKETPKKEEPERDRNSQKSEVSLYKLKAVQSINEFKSLELPQEGHENTYLTESKVREYQIHEKEMMGAEGKGKDYQIHQIHQSDQIHMVPEREQTEKRRVELPRLNEKVLATLESNKFFKNQFKFEPRTIAYASEVYEGQLELDNNVEVPWGYGKMYKADGALFVGQFVKGRAQGPGVYIFPDGSYYQGRFDNNLACDDNGLYKAYNFEYRGGFKNNTFEGKGAQKDNEHFFEGLYRNGQKVRGIYSWEDGSYQYNGPFENEKFHGKGTLLEPTGTYDGEFYYGLKHGKGNYHYNNGLRYEGQYKNNKRQGRGIIFNPTTNQPAYDGQFYDGLPHGEGFVPDENGNRVCKHWVMGVDSLSL